MGQVVGGGQVTAEDRGRVVTSIEANGPDPILFSAATLNVYVVSGLRRDLTV